MKGPALNILAEKHLRHLSETIGPRPVGSAGNQQAEHYISSIFKASELETLRQEFDCMAWRGGPVQLSVGGKSIPAALSPYSLSCKAEAPFILLESEEALSTAQLKGKVAVLGRQLTQEALMPKRFTFWNPERHQRIIRLLEEKAPVAIVTASFSETRTIPVIEDGDFDIPSVVVPGSTFTLFKANTGKKVSIQADAERRPSRGANVIARQPGQAADKALVLAHFDTKPDTPGALDNAAGVTVLLLLSSLLREKPTTIGVELIAVNGEDYYSNPGQHAYLDAFAQISRQVKLVCNCDGPGYKVGKTGVSPIQCPEELSRLLEQKLAGFPGLKASPPWYQGDHMIFAPYKIPIVAITSDEIFPIIDKVIHTENDKAELVEPEYLAQTARYIHELLGAL